jgi:hypothetical protein
LSWSIRKCSDIWVCFDRIGDIGKLGMDFVERGGRGELVNGDVVVITVVVVSASGDAGDVSWGSSNVVVSDVAVVKVVKC